MSMLMRKLLRPQGNLILKSFSSQAKLVEVQQNDSGMFQ